MRLQSLHIKNYGCLADLELTDLPSLAIFVGANGSGKSTLFDVFAFLRESLRDDVSTALRRRSGLSAVRTMGCGGPIEIEMQVRLDAPDRHGARRESCLTYQVAIDQYGNRPYVAFERCSYTDGESESIEARVAFEISRDSPEATDDDSAAGERDRMLPRDRLALAQPFPAVYWYSEAQVAARRGSEEGPDADVPGHPNMREMIVDQHTVDQLRLFLFDAYLSNVEVARAKRPSDVSGDRWLSEDGDNLAEVIRRLKDEDEHGLEKAVESARRMIPGLAGVSVAEMPDGRAYLQLKDDTYDKSFGALHVSDGSIKVLAYLVLLNEPDRRRLICIEEPENYLYPTVLSLLLEELRGYAGLDESQILIATHSPDLVDAAEPDEVFWFVKVDGKTTVHRVVNDQQLVDQHEYGDHLGRMWRSGAFEGAHPR